MSEIQKKSTLVKSKKVQGPLRWNAIIPFLIVSVLFYLYFVLFFDLHMKNAIEWAGYKALGVELNIGEFKTSFIKANVNILKIEITDTQNPEYNSVELGEVRFGLNWDALLRVKILIEEIAVDGVQLKTKRAHAGKVAPPEPLSNEPGFTDQLQGNALNKLNSENQTNILGDAAQFLKSGNFDDQLKNFETQLASKKLLAEMNSKWTIKNTEWSGKIKTLPADADFKKISDRVSKVKFKDFANLQELETSSKEVDSIVKEIDTHSKNLGDLKSSLETDLKQLDQDYKNVELQIKTDTEAIKSRFKIPKISAANFAKSLFMDYLTPYTNKIDHFRALAEKYLPPKYSKMLTAKKAEKNTSDSDDSIQPHPRSSGTSYEFTRANSYPMFWIRKIIISSKSNAQADYGDFNGLISNITSNQKQIGLPTVAKFEGNFNKLNIKQIDFTATLNNLKTESLVQFVFNIGSFPLTDLKLIDTKDGQISIPTANSQLLSSGVITDFKNYDFKLNNTFSNLSFQSKSENSTLNDVLKSTLSPINKFNLHATATGELKNLNIDIRSSLSADLEKAFQNLLQNKIKEANENLQKSINAELDKLKSEFNTKGNTLKSQVQDELKKVQSQIDSQKKQATEKAELAKKDFENKAKSDIQKEGQKQLDDLKKKLGF